MIDAGRASSTRPSTTRTSTSGPGTGYRLEGERWELLQSLPHVVDAAPSSATRPATGAPVVVEAARRRRATTRPRSCVAVGPAFGDELRETINGLAHARRARGDRATGSARAAATPRLVRVRRVADVAFIGHDGARLSGSGIAVGLQSKGTAVIHRADLQPLDNLELFGMSPLYSLESYRAIGPQRRRLRARRAGSGRCRPSSTTSRARS